MTLHIQSPARCAGAGMSSDGEEAAPAENAASDDDGAATVGA